MQEKIEQLKEWIDKSRYLVFFGGAGVSTESGIPDFRGSHGLYKQKRDIPLETILSHDYFLAHPDKFYEFSRESSKWNSSMEPNRAHIRLAQLEQEGKLKAVITQNADGLHQKAGSKNVLELHGNANRFYCMECGKDYPLEKVINSSDVPYCECGGLVRPAVVLFGEALDTQVLESALDAVRKADVFIVAGTSLMVYPAASLLDYYIGDRLVLINESSTPYDGRADLIINEKIGEVFAN